MPSAISSISAITPSPALQSSRYQSEEAERTPDARELQVREKFQEFTAGTFYKTMLKALRSSQHKPAYLHGGQAEDIFQSHLDNEFSTRFAKDYGDQFAGPLYDVYQSGRTV